MAFEENHFSGQLDKNASCIKWEVLVNGGPPFSEVDLHPRLLDAREASPFPFALDRLDACVSSCAELDDVLGKALYELFREQSDLSADEVTLASILDSLLP